ncbi:MAG: hypothetical protein EA001_00710 [Oscillatoriales cyanobacterium]|nr:MAG: hypothetical protein EA001_00710 [Oscillatoriales cyanobacterium]
MSGLIVNDVGLYEGLNLIYEAKIGQRVGSVLIKNCVLASMQGNRLILVDFPAEERFRQCLILMFALEALPTVLLLALRDR